MDSDTFPFNSEKVRLTVLVPTLNEERNLAQCLRHLQWADQVLVIDSGSTDRTAAIAAEQGAEVVSFAWNGQWPKKKNWALQNAPIRHQWVLIVDADEWITPELAAEIADAIRSGEYVGYYINRRFMFMGHWLRHCGYYPSWNLRLLRRGRGEYERLTEVEDTGSGDNEVHEHIVPDGPTGHLKNEMLHFAFPDIATFVEKHNRYSNWEAAVQLRASSEGEASGAGAERDLNARRRLKRLSRRLPFRPALRFFYAYILKRGFLDGRRGLIFCRLLAMYEFLSVAKYQEMRWKKEN